VGREAVGVDAQVAKEKVEAMRAERDAFAERLRHVEAVTLQQDTSAVEELQVLAKFHSVLLCPKWSLANVRNRTHEASVIRAFFCIGHWG
jgi:hypothetical protein